MSGEADAESVAAFEAVYAKFKQKHPGIEIEAEYLGDNAQDRLIQLVGSGYPPDLVLADSQDLSYLATQDYLDPVTDSVKQMGQLPDSSRLMMNKEDYILPSNLGVQLEFYRKDLFDAAGLHPVQTFADMQDALPKIQKDKSLYGNLLVTNAASRYTNTQFLASSLFNDAPSWKWEGGKWQVAMLDPDIAARTKEVLDFYKFRMDFSPETGNYDYPDIPQAYAAGKVAIIDYGGARVLQYLKQHAPDLEKVTGVTPIPRGGSAKKLEGLVALEGFGVFKQGPNNPVNRQIVKDLALALCTGEDYLKFLWTVPGHLIPPSKELRQGEWSSHPYLKQRPDLMAAIETVLEVGVTQLYQGAPDAGAPNFAEGRAFNAQVYAKMLANVIVKRKEAQSEIEAVAAVMSKELRKG